MKASHSLLSALCVLLLGSDALAKPLYITVPRTFSTQEEAKLSVAFEGKAPVELRVLKPDDVDKFIGAEVNLRRAYTPPSTQLNPGRYLARGWNNMTNPGRFMANALGVEFRRALAPALAERPESPREMAELQEGPAKLVSTPPGMTLVRSEWLNLDLGGAVVDYNVPGFDGWGGASGFQERQVTLPKLPAGVYVLQLVQENIEGQVTLVVTDQTVAVKQTDGKLLVRVAGRDQKPASGVAVSVFAPGTPAKLGGATNSAGEVLLEATSPKLMVVTKRGDDIAVTDTDFYSTLAVTPDVFIYSDRPIYKPGDEIQFRGVARKPASFLAQLFLPKKRSVEVSLGLQSGAVIKTQAVLDQFGSFSGALRVPAEEPASVVRLVAKLDQGDDTQREHTAEARVQEYIKPTFYLEVQSQQDSVTPGGKLSATVKARRYAGGVPKNTKYEVYLYRTQLDTPAWVDDAGRGGGGSAITYGSVSTTEGMLSIPKRLYSSQALRMENEAYDADPWKSAPSFDAKGEAQIAIDVPALEPGEEKLSFRYSLSIKARDDQNAEATGGKSFVLADCDVATQVAMSAKLVKKDAAATIAVRASTPGGKLFGEAEGTLALFLLDAEGNERKLEEKPMKTAADSTFRVAAPTGSLGTLIARATLKDKKGRTSLGEAKLLIIGDSGEAVASVPTLVTEALGDLLEPGGQAELAVLFPDKWGSGGANKGHVWVTLTGAGIFASELIEHSGRTLLYKFPIERRFGSVVYAQVAYPTASGRWDERSVAFRIVPKERVLSVKIEPGSAEVAPLGTQSLRLRVTDSDGKGVAAQVSLGVVDKAIYALQGELRPSVVDFFYPVGRNNVSTFYSIEFQGYGYGEALARMSRGLSPYQFAAVKPPTRRPKDLDRDTAYWNPALTTSRDGFAEVSFKMPSNQTLWVVTGVAADASGRFGEGRAEFASRGNMVLSVALPQFLREGDVATGSVRVSLNEGKAGTKVALSMAKTDGVDATSKELTLSKGDEQVVPFAIRAERSGAVSAEVRAAVTDGAGKAGDVLSSANAVSVWPASLQELVRVSGYGAGELVLPADGSRLLSRAEVSLMPSTVDAALRSVDDMLTYPFGCLEQLVATTIPNVALYHLLQKTGALSKLDPSSVQLLELARSRALQGIDRILALAQKGGGFTWFSGYSTPSVPLTLIALDGLAYAVEAGVVAKDAPELSESASWLAGQDALPLPYDATRAYVLARLQGAQAAPRVRALLETVEPTSDLHALAMAALAAHHAGVAEEPGVKERLAAVVQKSRTLGAQNAALNDDAFFAYPLRSVGLAAVVAHATTARATDADLASARQRFINAAVQPELSTFERSTLLLHHLWLIEKDAAALKTTAAPVVDAGSGPLAMQARGYGLGAALPVGATKVKVGSFDGVASLQAMVTTPFASVEPKSEGMSIKRNYYLLRDSGRKKLEPSDSVRVGDEVFVELEFDATPGDNWRRLRSAYYVIEDGVPAGFVVLQEDKAFRAAPYGLPLGHEALKQRQFTPEAATFFFEEPAFWSQRANTIGYVMRAQFAGQFQAPPARITDMYSTKVFGRTKASALKITAQ